MSPDLLNGFQEIIKRPKVHRAYRIPVYLVSGLLVLCVVVRAFMEKGDMILWFNHHQSAALNTTFCYGTRLGEAPMYWLAFLVLLFVKYRYALAILVGGAFSILLSGSLKSLFGYPRPFTWFNQAGNGDLLIPVPGADLYDAFNSFPSGHTLSAFMLFILLALIADGSLVKLLCVIAAIVVGLSRIYLQHHFFEDVIAGAFVGSIFALIIYTIQEKHLGSKKLWNRSLLHAFHKHVTERGA